MGRSRLLIVLLLVVVVVGGAIAFVMLGNPPAQQGQQPTSGTPGENNPTQPPAGVTVFPTPTEIPYLQVVIAVQEIPRGIAIAPDAVALIELPEEVTPVNAYLGEEGLQEVIGKIARTDIFREQVMVTALVTEDFSNLSKYGSDAAAVLPANRVAVSLPMTRLTSVAYAIKPGDRVDVIASFLFVDVDINFQSVEPNAIQGFAVTVDENGSTSFESVGEAVRANFETRIVPYNGQVYELPFLIIPSEQPRPRLATQRTIQDALVIWTGDFPEDGRIFQPPPPPTPTPLPEEQATPADGPPTATPRPPRPDIITLAVAPQDAVVLTWMVEAGIPVTFALRSAAATSLVQTETVSLDYIMTRFGIEVPEKFDYNIEPAIRSIRQLEVGERISLTQGE